MGEEEAATLEGQFYEFSRLFDNKRDGLTITLYRFDYWLRQTKLLDDRKITMTDTGILFNKYNKTELNWDEWMEFLEDLCELKEMDLEKTKETLTNCGLPGQTPVNVPQYRDFFLTYKPREKMILETYCNATYDKFLCWPPTPAGEVATQNCPPARLSDTSRLAFRRCGDSGLWLGRRPNESSVIGWTNYTPCFPPEVQTLFGKVYDDEKEAQLKFEIAQRTRYMEIAGFSISMLALIISLIIFSYYRSLRNNRTRIHKSLFCAMLVQVIIRLTVYIDQALIRSPMGDHSTYGNFTIKGIDNMPYLCESSYVLLEYAITVMFMWMFIEGLYLHNVVTANALRERISYLLYYATGWGIPFVVTAIWATMTALHYQRERLETCWYGYNFSPLYWIVQGPRLAVIMINLVFLLNIMRVLIVKLRQSQSTEMEKVRKAVRAALVLLPLLGITNILNLIEVPLDSGVWMFGLWSYSTHFLRSFQGFFIALIYCFLNGEVTLACLLSAIRRCHYVWDRLEESSRLEYPNDGTHSPERNSVRTVLKKHYEDYMSMRGGPRPARVSSSAERSRKESKIEGETSSWVQMRKLKWKRSSTKDNKEISVTEMGPEINQEKVKKVEPAPVVPENLETGETIVNNKLTTVAEINYTR